LPEPVFSHGQLYVPLSRATARSNIKILALPPNVEEGDEKDEKKDKKNSKRKDKKKPSVKEKKKSLITRRKRY
jgi:ATP-dependent DNA helicase PIF1